MKPFALFVLIVGMLVMAACGPAPAAPAAAGATAQAAPIPAGWTTYSSQQCEYALSYPSGMRVINQNPYSQLYAFQPASPDGPSANFVYVSVISPEIQNMAKLGMYNSDVYNYDPAVTDVMLKMQVGETKSLHPDPGMEPWYSFQRQADATVGGQPAQAYVNARPWEFPAGTKEIRYHVALGGCTYLIGGYMDTTGSNQPEAISEELFQQIVATLQLRP